MMNEQQSVINYVLKNEFSLRKESVKENATFKLGRQKFVIDF